MIKSTADVHLMRKITHTSGVLLMFACHYWLPGEQLWWALGASASVLVGYDLIRLQFPRVNKWTPFLFGWLMRRNEINQLTGTTYMFIGVAFLLLFFPRNIVSLSLLLLAFADPTASLFGVLFGKVKLIGKKTFEGSLAALIVCTVVAYFFLNTRGLMTDHLVVVCLIIGFIGAISELIPIWKLDDNLTQPLISAPSLSLLFYLFGGFLA